MTGHPHQGTAPGDDTVFLSAVFHNNTHSDILNKAIRVALKMAATALEYPMTHGIPIEHIDTHSFARYSDRQIQKLGRWQGETFEEYLHKQQSIFSEGMSTSVRKTFGFVNMEGGVFHDITETILTLPYSIPGLPAA
jgi:hypothetical protein